MIVSIQKIAQILGATLIGETETLINQVSSFDDAGPGDITFAADPKFIKKLDECNASAILMSAQAHQNTVLTESTAVLLCDNPKSSFFKLVQLFHPDKTIDPSIHDSTYIGKDFRAGRNIHLGPNVVIGDNVTIGDDTQVHPGSYIGDQVLIGNNVVIKPNVTILDKTIIGNNCIIHSGCTIGSDGFGFTQTAEHHEKLVHAGNVEILNNVEIGANCTVDRGTLGKTKIGNGVKIDNLVHIAHNVKIGDNTLIVSQVGIAGSTTIKENVILAGKAGISGHLTIGANAIVGPMAGVHSNVSEGDIVSGIPQMPHTRWRKVVRIMTRLPEMRKRLFSFEKRLKDIEKKF